MSRHRRSRLSAVGAASVLAFSGLALTSAGAAPASFAIPTFSNVPLSASLVSAPLVASGTAPSGSTVVLFEEPPTAVFAAHKSFRMTPVTRATVRAGKWQLRLPTSSAVIKADEEATGSASFEAIKFTATGTAVTFFGEQDLSHPVAAVLTQWVAAAVTKGATAVTPQTSAQPDSWCSKDFVKSLGEQKTLVGETFSSDHRATLNFTYTTNASSSLGVASSATGAAGSFSDSGTETSSAGGSDDFNPIHGAVNEYYDTYFGHALYKTSCFSGKGGSTTSYSSENTGWTTGTAQTAVKNPPYTAEVCAPESTAGVSVKVDKSSAVQWSNGFTLEGIGLTTQTGYATDAEVDSTWPANSNKTYRNRNCGVRNFPNLKGSLIAVARGV